MRGHELRHALHFEDAFRAVQRRIQDLLHDPALPTPAHARFVPWEVAEERLQEQFRAKMDAMVREESEKLQANIDTQDKRQNYAHEGQMCRWRKCPPRQGTAQVRRATPRACLQAVTLQLRE